MPKKSESMYRTESLDRLKARVPILFFLFDSEIRKHNKDDDTKHLYEAMKYLKKIIKILEIK